MVEHMHSSMHNKLWISSTIPRKNAANIKKHDVDFEDAEAVLLDPFALTWEDEDAEGEQRFLQLGMDAVGRVLVVVFTYRDDVIRLIAA